jgi:hypothetical protein
MIADSSRTIDSRTSRSSAVSRRAISSGSKLAAKAEAGEPVSQSAPERLGKPNR